MVLEFPNSLRPGWLTLGDRLPLCGSWRLLSLHSGLSGDGMDRRDWFRGPWMLTRRSHHKLELYLSSFTVIDLSESPISLVIAARIPLDTLPTNALPKSQSPLLQHPERSPITNRLHLLHTAETISPWFRQEASILSKSKPQVQFPGRHHLPI